jgi:hypothetical protein
MSIRFDIKIRCDSHIHIKIDVQIAYELDFGRSTYALKAKERTFLMQLVLCQNSSGIIKIM